jgi:hypothetical protein
MTTLSVTSPFAAKLERLSRSKLRVQRTQNLLYIPEVPFGVNPDSPNDRLHSRGEKLPWNLSLLTWVFYHIVLEVPLPRDFLQLNVRTHIFHPLLSFS